MFKLWCYTMVLTLKNIVTKVELWLLAIIILLVECEAEELWDQDKIFHRVCILFSEACSQYGYGSCAKSLSNYISKGWIYKYLMKFR